MSQPEIEPCGDCYLVRGIPSDLEERLLREYWATIKTARIGYQEPSQCSAHSRRLGGW